MNFANIRSWVKRCPEIYGDLVYRCRNIVGKTDLPVQFIKIVTSYKKKKKKIKSFRLCHFLWDHWAHYGLFENGVLLTYTLVGVSSVANLINAYEVMKSLNKTETPIF